MEESIMVEGQRQCEITSVHQLPMQYDGEESVEDILMTYSSDNSLSIPQVQTASSIPLIQFDSFEVDSTQENAFSIDTVSKASEDQPAPDALLLIPMLSLTSSPYNNEDRYCAHEINRSDETFTLPQDNRTSPLHVMHSQDLQDGPTVFHFRDTILDPESLVRTASSPTKLTNRWHSPPSSGTSSPEKAPGPLKNSLRNPYLLKKQVSLPISSREGLPGHFVADDEGMTNHGVDQTASPRKRGDEGAIFRPLRIPSPTVMRRSPSMPTSVMNSGKRQAEETYLIETCKTEKSDEDSVTDAGDGGLARRRRVLQAVESDQCHESDKTLATREDQPFFQQNAFQYTLYLSTYACFGTIVRVFLGRLLGYDCEFKTVNDWLYPLSSQICVTASGTTLQTGGALFVDLPANMLGSFILGVLTVLHPDVWPPIPWLKADHPLQKHHALHLAFRVGMCGSLTTFSSWNSQMVVMMDGSQTELGPQIVAAFYGYIVGTLTAIGCFVLGTHVSAWLNNWRNPVENNLVIPEQNVPSTVQFHRSGVSQSLFCKGLSILFSGRNIGFSILFILMTLFLVGDFVFHDTFYRMLWMDVLLTPPGALLRWSLATRCNGSHFIQGWDWLPVGTLAANVIGSIISIFVLALRVRYFLNENESWAALMLLSIGQGVAGSLSTVSTFVMELCEITNRFPNHAKAYYYWGMTIGASMFVSMIVYIPIVRSI